MRNAAEVDEAPATACGPVNGRIHGKITRWRHVVAIGCMTLVLGACGGGSSDSNTASKATVGPVPIAQNDASRFLAQSTMGANQSSVSSLSAYGYAAWLDEQFGLPARSAHQAYLDAVIASLSAGEPATEAHVINTFWNQAATGPDQLRQRVAFALSQIFVISMQDSNVADHPRGVAAYLDMLGRNAFGNYRDLLESVTLHPMMGLYLSHLRNQKESGNRVPDQNYAREVMQLLSIGLYELNPDGTLILDTDSKPVETYGPDDIAGLSRVFTGFSWAGPDKQDGRFFGSNSNPTPDPNREVLPMQAYPNFHSTSEKRFLGTTIPSQSSPDPLGSLRIALDTLFHHHNVGPFIGRQLIQRLVTSNPSPAYVGRVAQAFNTGRYSSNLYTTGSGRRGDLRATIAAVLLDTEARDMTKTLDAGFGKVREPVLRLSAWMRAFNVRSASGKFLLGATDNPAASLGQSPLRSPSVFNFYRPGYVPPNTGIAAANLVAPEFQIIHESSVVGYANFMRSVVRNGIGDNSPADIQPDYAAELAVADDPDKLIDRVNLLLTYGTMRPDTMSAIREAVTSVAINASNPTPGRQNRVYLAALFTMSAPEFVVQK
jgi:uncharacterized protein (DUF1800 family)